MGNRVGHGCFRDVPAHRGSPPCFWWGCAVVAGYFVVVSETVVVSGPHSGRSVSCHTLLVWCLWCKLSAY